MICRSILEWGYLDVAEDGRPDAIPRRAANALLTAARHAGFGDEDSERILVDGHRRLRGQQVVGILSSPLARLEILPKIDGLDAGATRRILVHMLARVFDLDIASGRIADFTWQRQDLLEIVIGAFCRKLFDVVRRGLPRRYAALEDDLRVLRGRLDLKRQFTTLLSSPQVLACRYDELSPDIALNQVMKAVIRVLMAASRSDDNQRLLRELALAFADVRTVAVDALRWNEVVLDRTNQDWAELFAMAEFLLKRRYQTTSEGEQAGFSLLFPMNTLFEEYIGRGLQAALRSEGRRVRLQKPRSFALLDEAGARRFATKPDIVIFDEGKPSIIIDTKWKRLTGALDDPRRGVGQADVYQMLAYARVYGVKRLMLLYPHHDGLGASEGVLARFQLIGDDAAKLAIGSVRLGGAEGLAGRLQSLVRAMSV